MYDCVIIGSGPAGLAAAIYAQRAKLECVVLEKAGISGGQVLTTYEVDNYPGLKGIGGFDLGNRMREHADTLEAVFNEETVTQVVPIEYGFRVVTKEMTYLTKTVIIATGAKHATLNVPGENELSGMGVSYCATCDGAFFKNRTVAVVGGGDVAVEDAIFLARLCKKVFLVHRRDELRAAGSLQKSLLDCSNVEVLWNCTVKEIHGEDQVESMVLQSTKDGSEENVSVDGVFVAVGIHPNTEAFKELVNMNDSGYIIAGEDGCTSVSGIFAAGDVRKKPLRQIVTAVADGANCVNSVQEYLRTSKSHF